ncbi:hypothetical protein AG1IA_05138 [Rhizoctonia solani AG-1 IA]|uniref:Uncharacterized protein n=1 Tax=Thanatephorus cucumeris (strain AG1-IA) TaxID=983506 RepID=L8WVK7_THACA|nr:hypothetical protein AG1IA_05138 [Rhizoctonia solani AG-1 IA]
MGRFVRQPLVPSRRLASRQERQSLAPERSSGDFSKVQPAAMQKESTLGRVGHILMSMAGKMHPVMILHRLEYSLGSCFSAGELRVLGSVAGVSPDRCEFPGGAWQLTVAGRSRLANSKHARNTVWHGRSRGEQCGEGRGI